MPYPDYAEISGEKPRRKAQEIEYGRQKTMQAMAEGLLQRMQKDYGLPCLRLNSSNPDPRKWMVVINDGNLPVVEESFWDFPSETTIATLMLLGKHRGIKAL